MIEKNSKFTNNYKEKSEKYAQHKKNEGTLSIAYNAFEEIFSKHVKSGNLAIDIGSGAGRSRKFLEEVGFDADGVDIDPNMMSQAKFLDSENTNKYQLIENDIIPHRSSKYDLAFSSLVVLEIPTKEKLSSYFKEAERVMKFEGTLIVLTVSDDFYKYDWVSVDTNYQENKFLKSGDKVKVKIKEINLELYDYFWTKLDYIEAANEASLTLIDELYPKGSVNDEVNWISEIEHPPYGIYIFKKSESLKNSQIIANENGLLIEMLGHGIFSEIERSTNKVMVERSTELGTKFVQRDEHAKIRLVLGHNDKLNFHSFQGEEILTHIKGNDVLVHIIDEEGNYNQLFLGSENENSEKKITIKPGVVFSEEVIGNYAYSLIEAETKPAFSSEDFKEYSEQEVIKLLNNNSFSFFMERNKNKSNENIESNFKIENN